MEGFEKIDPVIADRGGRTAIDMRNVYADYFSSEGAVPWQHDK